MPVLWLDNIPAYEAFWELNPERMNGFGEGYIPRREIRDYASDEELDFRELLWKVRAMDRAYLEFKSEKAERDQEHEKAKREQAQRIAERRGRR